MVTQHILYQGDLRCLATHAPSAATLATDAPKDNHGRGESFSPTDLLATALATCILTTMAISLKKHGLDLGAAKCTIHKSMTTTPPRRIASLSLELTLPASIPEDRRPPLEASIHACPVHRSLHPDIQTPVTIKYE